MAAAKLLSMVLSTIYTCWVLATQWIRNDSMDPPPTWSNSFIFAKRLVKNVPEVGAWGGSMVCQSMVCTHHNPTQALGACPPLPSQPTNGKFWIHYWICYYVNLPILCGGQECYNSHNHKNWEDKTIKQCIPYEEIPEIIFTITVSSFNEMYKIKNMLRNLNF